MNEYERGLKEGEKIGYEKGYKQKVENAFRAKGFKHFFLMTEKEIRAQAIEQTRNEDMAAIKDSHKRMLLLYEGKLPFTVFQGKADGKEKVTIYEQAINFALASIKKLSNKEQ